MKRRKFLHSAVVGGLGASLGSAVSGLGQVERAQPTAATSNAFPSPAASQERPSFLMNIDPNGRMMKIGRWTLEELRDYFKKDLFEKRLPLWLEHGIDRRFGGYLTEWNKDGKHDTFDKRIESQGRTLWLFSYFFNNFDQRRILLDAARQGMEALLRYGRDERGRWRVLLTQGWTVKDASPDPGAAMGVALGFNEYAKIRRDPEAQKLAGEAALAAAEAVLAPHFQPDGPAPSPEPGTKKLSTWAGFLEALTPLVESSKRRDIEAMARMCVRFILQYHRQKSRGWAMEYLRQDFTPYPNDTLGFAGRTVSGRNGVEAARAVMSYALQSGNRPVFLEAMELGLQTLEICWESGPEFGLIDFEDIDGRKKAKGGGVKSPGALSGILALTLGAIEHAHSANAARWFNEVFECVWNRPGIWNPADGFHEIRGSIFCLEAVNRMIARKGHVSPFFF